MASRPVQDGSQSDQKNDAFFDWIFHSSWGRLGVVLGVVLGAKSHQKIVQRLGKTVWDVDFSPWASLRSFQEGKANDGQA